MYNVATLNVSALSKKQIINKCIALISENSCKSVVTLNSLMLLEAWRKSELREAIKRDIIKSCVFDKIS